MTLEVTRPAWARSCHVYNHPVTWFLLVLPFFKTEKHATWWVILLWSIFGRFIWNKIFQQSINCRETLWPAAHIASVSSASLQTRHTTMMSRPERRSPSGWLLAELYEDNNSLQSCWNKLLALRLDSVIVWRRRWWIYISHACVLERRVSTVHSDGRQHHINTANQDKLVRCGFKKQIGFSCRLKMWMLTLVIDLLFLLLRR